MAELVKTMKLRFLTSEEQSLMLRELTDSYRQACNFISEYSFGRGCILSPLALQKFLYYEVRNRFNLPSQMTVSAFKTVTARYKTVQAQLIGHPFSYKDENGERQYILRTLEWLTKPVLFSRPQADLVRGRDYSFITDRKSGHRILSLNTLHGRIHVPYVVPECFLEYFDSNIWSMGTGKVVNLNGEWYIHIPVTRKVPDSSAETKPAHIVGIDRGLRFVAAVYDEKGCAGFVSGQELMEKRDRYEKTRAQLQAKGTKSAKRVLRRISGRENRWMSDVNHQITKALVSRYGKGTLFVLEDLNGVSFDEKNLSGRKTEDRRQLRSWAFYQFEQILIYKAAEKQSSVIEVSAAFTSQRCPKCGRIRRENRNHSRHEYLCDSCGFRANDDQVGAMNLYTLGTMYVSGDTHPRFGHRKTE